MPYVPPEIVFQILSWLPVKAIIRFKLVCKLWHNITKDPIFIKHRQSHTVQSNANLFLICKKREGGYFVSYFDEEAKFLNAVTVHPTAPIAYHREPIYQEDGLVFFVEDERTFETFWVWNPLSNKCKTLRFDPIEYPPNHRKINRVNFGFVYDDVNDDLKAIRIVHFADVDIDIFGDCSSPSGASEVRVLSLKNHSCRRVQDWPLGRWDVYHSKLKSVLQGSVFLNGNLHWYTYSYDCEKAWQSWMTVCFDVKKEEFNLLRMPVGFHKTPRSSYFIRLIVLGGRLTLCMDSRDAHEVWTMTEYGVSESWTKLYSMKKNTIIKESSDYLLFTRRPLILSKNGYGGERVLVDYGDILHYTSKSFYWYDLQRKTYDIYEVMKSKSMSFLDLEPYVCTGSFLLFDF